MADLIGQADNFANNTGCMLATPVDLLSTVIFYASGLGVVGGVYRTVTGNADGIGILATSLVAMGFAAYQKSSTQVVEAYCQTHKKK